LSKLGGRLAFACIPFAVFACVVDNGSGSDPYASGGSGSAGSTGVVATDGSPSAHPMNVSIDTNQTMNVAPGDGVGVFVEYDSGGNWNVWWTCDSRVDPTNTACGFDVKITAQSGALTNLVPQTLAAGDAITQPTPASVEATTTTSTGTDGFTFTTSPGAEILLDASIGGQHNGNFVFFVQGGKVNDGFSGTLTDPIYMQGSAP
jgi:hypothetical protein